MDASEASRYVRRSRRKYELAERHLTDLRVLLPTLDVTDFDGGDALAPAVNHGDGCVVQLFAAFDAWACAAAHRFELPAPDEASFSRVALHGESIEAGWVADALEEIRASKVFRDLAVYRNLAAHRGLVAERTSARLVERGAVAVTLRLPVRPPSLPDPPRADVLPILERLVESTREPLETLWALSEDW